MADITAELQQILAAVLGEEVRGSIYSAIDKINKVSEKVIDSGTSVHDGDPRGNYFDKSLYINTETDELLRCGPTNWARVGNIRGNGISEITGPVKNGLIDTYTIVYTDGEEYEFSIVNGRGIVSFVLSNQSGLIDTYTITYNDNSTGNIEITNGNQWQFGQLISGKDAINPTVVTLPYAVRPGDCYLNNAEDAVYHCTDGAPAGVASNWIYDFTIAGSSGGTNDFTMLINKPAINGNTLTGNKSSASLGLQDKLTEGTGIKISNLNVISADVDLWLMDTSQTPQVPLVRPMPVDSTEVIFTAAEMAQVPNDASVKAYFSTAIGTKPPTFKYMRLNLDGSLTIAHTKVKSEQASGGACNCKLRIVK